MRQSLKPAAYALLILGIGAGVWWAYEARESGRALPGPRVAQGRQEEQHHGSPQPGPVATAPARVRPAVVADNLLQRLATSLESGRAEKSRRQLAGLHEALRKLPRGEAARQLLAFLNSGVDAASGLPFAVGRGGWLETAPTMRVAALDWLGEFDPAAAADFARQIFAHSNSADEWALALRNYYRQNQTADAYFVARVGEAFSREGWLQNPSAGLAESLDFPVAIGGTEGLSLLEGLMQRSPPLRWAALAALDAWVLQQRATAIPLLAGSAADAGALDAGSRAALLSRADIRDGAQRAAIESYLGAAAVPQAAKAEFLRQFPNQNMILANHLVTTSQPMSLEESARLDAAALQFVERSIQAGTYPELGKELAASRERLAGFVASARRGGKL